jgi:hypothetical protein
MAIILEPSQPGKPARQIELEEAPMPLLRQLVMSGSREAAAEYKRRLQERR